MYNIFQVCNPMFLTVFNSFNFYHFFAIPLGKILRSLSTKILLLPIHVQLDKFLIGNWGPSHLCYFKFFILRVLEKARVDLVTIFLQIWNLRLFIGLKPKGDQSWICLKFDMAHKFILWDDSCRNEFCFLFNLGNPSPTLMTAPSLIFYTPCLLYALCMYVLA